MASAVTGRRREGRGRRRAGRRRAGGMGWARLLRALWRTLSREAREQVGTDPLGNKYYYVPSYRNWRGQIIREKRIIEAANKNEVDYQVGNIPTEWEAWIRGTRKNPPTLEEILRNKKYREDIEIKSKEFYVKEKLLSKDSNGNLLVPPVETEIKGHASAPYYGKEEPSAAPSSTGKTFQPGAWMPQDGKSRNQ